VTTLISIENEVDKADEALTQAAATAVLPATINQAAAASAVAAAAVGDAVVACAGEVVVEIRKQVSEKVDGTLLSSNNLSLAPNTTPTTPPEVASRDPAMTAGQKHGTRSSSSFNPSFVFAVDQQRSSSSTSSSKKRKKKNTKGGGLQQEQSSDREALDTRAFAAISALHRTFHKAPQDGGIDQGYKPILQVRQTTI
jgi:hypothetical protein